MASRNIHIGHVQIHFIGIISSRFHLNDLKTVPATQLLYSVLLGGDKKKKVQEIICVDAKNRNGKSL